jgi:hypothetical protein
MIRAPTVSGHMCTPLDVFEHVIDACRWGGSSHQRDLPVHGVELVEVGLQAFTLSFRNATGRHIAIPDLVADDLRFCVA